MSKKIQVRDLVQVSMMSIVITLCSWIAVPAAVPFTMQTFGVFVCLKLLGGWRGTLSVLLYILLGLVGIPVFSSFRSGVGVLLGPTGGYILGFLLMALMYHLTARVRGSALAENLILCAGLFACYAFGTIWFVYLMGHRGSPISWLQALLTCVLPYILPDLLKLFLADRVAKKLRSAYPSLSP